MIASYSIVTVRPLLVPVVLLDSYLIAKADDGRKNSQDVCNVVVHGSQGRVKEATLSTHFSVSLVLLVHLVQNPQLLRLKEADF